MFTPKTPVHVNGCFWCDILVLMKYESLHTLSTVEDEHVHLDPDSHVYYSVMELKGIADLETSRIEDHFETHMAEEELQEIAIAHYESMINTPGAFLGIGNTALVFKQHPGSVLEQHCVKCRWDFLMVNNKSKKIQALPENLRRLKQVENHFEKVTKSRNEARGKNVDVTADSPVLREVLIQHLACQVMNNAGKNGAIPDVHFIIKIEREESGDVEGDPFSVSETVNLIFMDQVQGLNIEEILYEASPDIAQRFSVEIFEQELFEMLEILHNEGVTHGDLTIRNIMIDPVTLKLHIIDFGRGSHSKFLSEDEKEKDRSSAREIVKFMSKFKHDPAKTADELKQLHSLTL